MVGSVGADFLLVDFGELARVIVGEENVVMAEARIASAHAEEEDEAGGGKRRARAVFRARCGVNARQRKPVCALRTSPLQTRKSARRAVPSCAVASSPFQAVAVVLKRKVTPLRSRQRGQFLGDFRPCRRAHTTRRTRPRRRG